VAEVGTPRAVEIVLPAPMRIVAIPFPASGIVAYVLANPFQVSLVTDDVLPICTILIWSVSRCIITPEGDWRVMQRCRR
jgi:hypothetical protein